MKEKKEKTIRVSNKADNYFEGYLQLRDCSKEVLTFARELMYNDGCTIAKEARLKGRKGSIDFWVSSNKTLLKLARQLPNNFIGIVRSSNTLHTRDSQTSKELYRGTLLFKQIPFSIGDDVHYRGDVYSLVSVHGDKVDLKDMKTGKRKSVKGEEINQLQ